MVHDCHDYKLLIAQTTIDHAIRKSMDATTLSPLPDTAPRRGPIQDSINRQSHLVSKFQTKSGPLSFVAGNGFIEFGLRFEVEMPRHLP
jgi:hypothetical protein